MITNEFINKNYDLDFIEKIYKTKFGSGNTYIIITSQKKYLLKELCKVEDVEMYNLISHIKFDVKIPTMYMNCSSEFLTDESFVLFDYIEGETLVRLEGSLEKDAIRNIRLMNEKLKSINSEIQLRRENDWDRIRDNEYIMGEAFQRVKEAKIPNQWKVIIGNCFSYFNKNEKHFKSNRYQLIHMDLGPDNFLIEDESISGIIDFTPAFNFELLSLAHFVYWNYLWYEEVPQLKQLDKYLIEYLDAEADLGKKIEYKISLMLACLYRVLGPLFNMEMQDEINLLSLNKRINILESMYNTIVINEI